MDVILENCDELGVAQNAFIIFVKDSHFKLKFKKPSNKNKYAGKSIKITTKGIREVR